MASGVNKVILIGNLGADPELKYTPSGAAVCELRLATNDSWTGKDGQKQDRTEWHKVVVWNKLGEMCAKYLAKGRTVYIEGKITTEQWTDKEGNKRYTTKIIARDVTFLGGRGEDSGGGGGGYGAPAEPTQPSTGGGYGGPDDDIPF